MKELIYYPRFESQDENWLKFSMLYMESFIPIIPQSGRRHLSNNYSKILDETDLIQPYEPKYLQGERATLKAIKDVEEILSSPHKNSVLFNAANVKRKMENPLMWTETLFQEKYTDEWNRFCLDSNLGKKSNEGLLISEELAMIYMTTLAQEIAFETDASTITDIGTWDNYTTYKRAKSPNFLNKANLAKTVLDLTIPDNLSEISFDRLIKFRNINRKYLTAFNTQLDITYESISNGLTAKSFIDGHNNIFKEYSLEVAALSLRTAVIPLGLWILISKSEALTAPYVKEILGGLGVTIAGVLAMKKGYKNLEGKRYSKKYISNLEKIKK